MSTDLNSPPKKRSFLQLVATGFKRLGPGLVTGAADDEPSGIATYSQAGAQFGYSLLWTLFFSIPLMGAIQEISGRIGRVTGRGIADNIRLHYSAWVLWPIVLIIVTTNVITLGADIGAMGDAARSLIGGPMLLYCAIFTLLCLALEIFSSYDHYARILKWLTLVLFCYVATAFCVHVPWGAALRHVVLPDVLHRGGDYWAMIIAVLGTTISPYLFFWQAGMECEEMRARPNRSPLHDEPAKAPRQFRRIRLDTITGVFFSNIVGLFIMLAAAATLHAHGVTNIQTSAQAAQALQPIAGKFAFALFALGIVGTALLGLPTLAGSAAYVVAEAMRWPSSLDDSPLHARGFNIVLTAAMLLGLAMNLPLVQHLTHLSPIDALVWAAVVNGLAAPPVMIVVMLMHQNKKVMGQFTRGAWGLNTVGWLATAAMTAAAIGMLLTRHHA